VAKNVFFDIFFKIIHDCGRVCGCQVLPVLQMNGVDASKML
jgi:hypothetical protein